MRSVRLMFVLLFAACFFAAQSGFAENVPASPQQRLEPILKKVNGSFLLLANWTDQSYLTALYYVYSLSDESELSAGLYIPIGARSMGTTLLSEYGSAPNTLHLEYRLYF